jgi:Iron dependent repressor, N-terminal DNA binding domain
LACIFELIAKKGHARVMDIAASLSVTEPSASAMITRLGRVCKSVYGQRGYVQVELVMRLRPKVKRLLPKIAEAIISIEIDSLEKR